MKGVVIFFTVVIIILICVFAYFATKNMHENFQTNNDSEHPCFNIKIDDNENHKKEAADNNCESVKIGNTQFYVPPSRIAECKDGDVIFASIKDDKSEISCKSCPVGMTSNDGKECILTETKQVCADNTYEKLSNFNNDTFNEHMKLKQINELKYHYSNYKPSDRKCTNFSKCSVNDSWVTNYNSLLANAYTNDSSKKYFEDISCDTLTTKQSSQYFIDNDDNFNPDNLLNIPGTTQKVNITDRVFKPLATNCVKGHHISPTFTTASSSELSALNGYYASDRICDKCGDNTYTDKTNQVECAVQTTAPTGFGMPADYYVTKSTIRGDVPKGYDIDKTMVNPEYAKIEIEKNNLVECNGDTNYSDENGYSLCEEQRTCGIGQVITKANPVATRKCDNCAINTYQDKVNHRVTKCDPQTPAPTGFGMPTDYVSNPTKYARFKIEEDKLDECDGDTYYSDVNNYTPCKTQPVCGAGQIISETNPVATRNCIDLSNHSCSNEKVPGCYMPNSNHRREDYITRSACSENGKVHVPECENEFKYKGDCLADSEPRPICPT